MKPVQNMKDSIAKQSAGDPNSGRKTLEARTRRPRGKGRARPRGGKRRRRGKKNNSGGNANTSTTVAETPAPKPAAPVDAGPPSKVEIPEVISVRDLAAAMGTNPIEIIKTLMVYGTMSNINEIIDFDTAAIVGEELGIEVVQETIAEAETEPGSAGPKTLRERLIEMEEDPDKLIKRPPVVTVLGHVDHGKTTLLDAIRDTNVVAGESGGITQHIAAYQIELNGDKITFLDTPGHAAFTAMRARGAQATDIAILVVAADDGVMPQTREAIAHARAARVPIIVALNKIDKDNANPDRVKQQLSDTGLQPEDWGGDTTVVPISAKARQNIEELLENVVLMAEVMDLKANPDGEAVGTVIEANQDRRLGSVASVLVQKGTLRVGDSLVLGNAWGRVRAMFDDQGRTIDEAPPASPVLVTGLHGVPSAGDIFQVVETDRVARHISQDRTQKAKLEQQTQPKMLTLDDLYSQIQSGAVKDLNLIIKADVQGSLEPIVSSLEELSSDEVSIRILHKDVGRVTESDVMLAAASHALILGFHTQADTVALSQAEQQGVSIQLYDVIYHLIDDVSKAMTGMLEPIYEERKVGTAEVRAVFRIRGRGKILGCMVRDGEIRRDAIAAVLRGGKEIYRGKITSLKRFQEDVPEVRVGYECGIGIDGFDSGNEEDIVQVFERVRVR